MKRYDDNQYRLTLDLCRMYADFCEEDEIMKEAIIYMARNKNEVITIATLSENLTAERRVGIRNSRGKIKGFQYENTSIGRSKAEKIVEKLAFAGLINVEPQLPLKFLTLSIRGKQVALELQQRQHQKQKEFQQA